MPFAEINDVNLYYETRGTGAPLFLIAGLASDSLSWSPIVADLSPHCRVITFDNRGAGRTSPQETEISIRRISDDCLGLARHLGLASFNLLGHSMGGFVALDCAIRYPQAVGKLILAATAAVNSQRNNALFSDLAACRVAGMDPQIWFRNLFYWIFTTRFFENGETVRDAVRVAREYPYPQSSTAFAEQVRAIAEFDCTGRLSEITARTKVIAGREDLLFAPAECAALAQAIPGADFALIDAAAHSIHMENRRAFATSVLDFLLSD